ncbi:Fructosamine kinase-domain-containing protein, partial [Staphylotrichum tortipilum]
WFVTASNSSRAFFLAEFRDMTDNLPGVSDIAAIVSKIHQQRSPNGKFGFHVTTFSGKHASDNAWCNTWEEFFTRATRDTMEGELAIHGPDEELEGLSEKILTEGRRIQPVLLHGDLWHGNVSVDNATKEPILYDPCCFYGHNEYDFGMWRASRYRLGLSHVQAYLKLAEPNEPSKDQDDRHALYAMQVDVFANSQPVLSICWPANKKIRELAKEEMRRLVGIYGDGYEGYLASKKLTEESAKDKAAPAVSVTQVLPESPTSPSAW